MPVNVVHGKRDEERWSRAKAAAAKQGQHENWPLIMHIYESMKGDHASKSDDRPVDQFAAGPTKDTSLVYVDEHRVRPRFYTGKPHRAGGDPDPAPEHPAPEETLKGGKESPEDRRARNAKPSNRAARREYMHTAAGQEANRKAQENYRRDHPDRVSAQHAARAKHGESRSSGHKCASCGKPAEHKHHTDYGNPESVKWLCHDHHVQAHHPKSDLAEKSMTDNWFDEYRGSPLFLDAINLEQEMLAHQVERRAKEKQRDAVRAAAERQAAKEESIWDWADRFRTGWHAKRDKLKQRHLEWMKQQEQKLLGKAETKGRHKSPPKENREAGAKHASDYADPEGFRYPIHDEEHVRAAISYFSMPRNNSQYSPEKRAEVWGRIRSAAKKFGIELSSKETPGSKHSEKSMSDNDLFKAIMARDAFDAGELSKGIAPTGADLKRASSDAYAAMGAAKEAMKKAKDDMERAFSLRRSMSSVPMVSHPRPGQHATQGGGGDPAGSEQHVPMVSHPRPGGGGQMDKAGMSKKPGDAIDNEMSELEEKALKAMGSAYDAACKACEMASSVSKAMATSEDMGDGVSHGGGAIGATQTLPAEHNVETGEPFSGPQHGYPHADPGAAEVFSDADKPVEQMMTEHQQPVFGSMGHGGAGGLEAVAHRHMGGDVSAGGGVEKSFSAHGALGPQVTFENQRARVAAERAYQLRVSGDRSGVAVYSTAEDAHISGLLSKSREAHVHPSPAIPFNSPMIQGHTCSNDLCKSSYPAFLSTCPRCGTDSMLGHVPARPTHIVQKSLIDQLRAPPARDQMLPGGLLQIDE